MNGFTRANPYDLGPKTIEPPDNQYACNNNSEKSGHRKCLRTLNLPCHGITPDAKIVPTHSPSLYLMPDVCGHVAG